MEDDLIVSRDCLNYLDKALDFYEKDKGVWSISACTPPLKKKNKIGKDIYYAPRAESWGWGTWADRWEKVDWNIEDYDLFLDDFSAQLHFSEGGYDLPYLL